MASPGLSTSWAKLILDPIWTRPAGIEWRVQGLETDRQCQSIESVLGSGGARVGSVDSKVCRKLEIVIENWKSLSETAKLCWNLQIFAEICYDLAGFG